MVLVQGIPEIPNLFKKDIKPPGNKTEGYFGYGGG